jgi:Protein of unknown function (DUF3710)
MVLRRRRRERAGQASPGTGPSDAAPAADELPELSAPGDEGAAGRPDRPGGEGPSGPWDSAAGYPELERIDCGSLLVPVREGMDVQINISEEQGIWVAVVRGGSGIQLQAFAAPRGQGLWGEVRQEIADNVADAGGSSREEDGPFGRELHARVRIGDQGSTGPPEPVRFLGADGPRWFLRGLISGPAAEHSGRAADFEEVFRQVVVVRGDHPKPPKEQLEIRLPEEARQALEAELGEGEFALPPALQDEPPGTGPGY